MRAPTRRPPAVKRQWSTAIATVLTVLTVSAMACVALGNADRADADPAPGTVATRTAPAAPLKSALVKPSTDYWGVSEDGLPGSPSKFDALDDMVGKAPSTIGFFSYWNSPFPAGDVTAAWDRGALPVMTWMSIPSDGTDLGSYNMTDILDGDWDNYLTSYAQDIVDTGLPMVIRFDHEMNGDWFPWSASVTSDNNSAAKYVAMWRHVWNIFQQAGANAEVIWLWAPNRVDNIQGYSWSSTLAADYPGDQYVDWVGASVYWRSDTELTDFATSFAETIAQLKAVTSKPIFFPEIGALQNYHGTNTQTQKQAWMSNTVHGFLADPTIIGFNWFDNESTTADDPGHLHDWRINSSLAVITTFKQLVRSSSFAGGTMP